MSGRLNERLSKGKTKLQYYYKKARGIFITSVVLSSVFAISMPLIVILNGISAFLINNYFNITNNK